MRFSCECCQQEENLAMRLMDDGKGYAHAKRCGCERCQLGIVAIRQRHGGQYLTLAEAFYAASPGVQFQAMVDDWPKRQIINVVLKGKPCPEIRCT